MEQAPTAQVANQHVEQLKVLAKQSIGWRNTASAFASTTSYKARMEAFLALVESLLGNGNEAFIVKGSAIKYAISGREITKQHRYFARMDDKFIDEENALFQRKFRITNTHDLVVISKTQIQDDALGEKLKEYAQDLNLTRKPLPIRTALIGLTVIAAGLIPFDLPIIGDAVSTGEYRNSIAATSAGTIKPIAKPGFVREGEVIAELAAVQLDNQAQILASRIDELKTQLAQSDDTNVYLTLASIKATKEELDGLEKTRSLNKITAPSDGVLEWDEQIQGRYLNPGDVIGSIDQADQTLMQVRVAAKDWRPENNQKGVFTSNDNVGEQIIEGKIEHAPTIIKTDQGIPEYVVLFRLAKPVILGDTGTVSFHGEATNLFGILFKTPIKYAKAWFRLYTN